MCMRTNWARLTFLKLIFGFFFTFYIFCCYYKEKHVRGKHMSAMIEESVLMENVIAMKDMILIVVYHMQGIVRFLFS